MNIDLIIWQSEMDFYKNLALTFIVAGLGIAGYIFANFDVLSASKLTFAFLGLFGCFLTAAFFVLKYRGFLGKIRSLK